MNWKKRNKLIHNLNKQKKKKVIPKKKKKKIFDYHGLKEKLIQNLFNYVLVDSAPRSPHFPAMSCKRLSWFTFNKAPDFFRVKWIKELSALLSCSITRNYMLKWALYFPFYDSMRRLCVFCASLLLSFMRKPIEKKCCHYAEWISKHYVIFLSNSFSFNWTELLWYLCK